MLNLLVTAVDLDDIKYHVVVKQVIDVDDALYFTRIDRRDEKLRHSYHCTTPLADSQGGVKS